MNEKQKKEYFEFLINEYDEGRARIRGNHPKEVQVAIDTFFKAGKILVDNPEIDKIPDEYVTNLLKSLSKYPQYHQLVHELIDILNQNEHNDG
jgi:hypothetical protein|tara:strand:+ start:1187 stop:1465 length:279 start_codon:yes stop_codon:yes gene_type:complete